MEHRKTPPVLRRTKPELLADEQRFRRGRQRLGLGLAWGGALVVVLSAGVAWFGGVAADTAIGMAVGLVAAAAGVWALRLSADRAL